MGIAVGDYRNNGLVDLYTTTFSDDYKTLFRNDGDGNFSEITTKVGIAEVTYPFLSWGTEFIDYDNDGWKDIMFVGGHVFPIVDKYNWGTSYAERPLLFHNVARGTKFEVVPAIQRREDRRRDQLHRPYPCPVAQRQYGSQPLGGNPADWRVQKPA
jgi:hypothetical protein